MAYAYDHELALKYVSECLHSAKIAAEIGARRIERHNLELAKEWQRKADALRESDD